MGAAEDLVYIDVPPRLAGAGAPPLLILLHGIGSHEGDLLGLAPALDARFHLVALRGPYTLFPGSYAWFHVDWAPAGVRYEAAEAAASRDLLATTIPALVTATGADPRRVYLLGFSQGAMLALYLALTDPVLVAGVVAMSGTLLPEVQTRLAPLAALAGLPVLAVHGTADAVLPVLLGRAAHEFLATLPIDLTYREYPMGHEVSPASLADVGAWLAARLDHPDPAAAP